jgi:hypothetical protein
LAVIAEGRLSPPHATADTNLEQIGVWMSGQFEAATPADYVADPVADAVADHVA